MNLSWLDDFLALAASGSFSRAADQRHMTQPAFSRRIRALEEWLGVELFDRRTQPARLTPAGEWFRGVAEDLLARVERVPADARAVADAGAATLRLAATHALSFTFVPGWLRRLEPQLALGPVRLVSDVLQHCEALLLAGQVQFVVAHAHPRAPGPLDAAGCASCGIGDDALLPLAGRGVAVPDDGAGDAMPAVLGYSGESGLGRLLQALLGAELQPLRAGAQLSAHLASVLKTMVLEGRGVAWLPERLVRDELAAGRLAVVGPARWRLALQVRLYRQPQPLGPAGEAFWQAAVGAAAAGSEAG